MYNLDKLFSINEQDRSLRIFVMGFLLFGEKEATVNYKWPGWEPLGLHIHRFDHVVAPNKARLEKLQ